MEKKMNKTLVIDFECDGLLDTVTTIHCLTISDLDGNTETYTKDGQLGYKPLEDGVARLLWADTVVCHNFWNYDHLIIKKFFGPEVANKFIT